MKKDELFFHILINLFKQITELSDKDAFLFGRKFLENLKKNNISIIIQ